MSKRIIILDSSDSSVRSFPYDENVYKNHEDFYDAVNSELGFYFTNSQCDYMIVEELKIQIH